MVLRALLGLALIGLLGAQPSSAADRPYPVRVAHQLTRGIANVSFCWLEIPVNMYKEQQRAHDHGVNLTGEGAAALAGTLTGIQFMVVRAVVGVGEIATFLVPSGPWVRPISPNSFIETLGPPSPHSFFRLARRGGETPRYERRFWERDGASEQDWYDDRWRCAQETLRNGLFNACLEASGWQRTAQEY